MKIRGKDIDLKITNALKFKLFAGGATAGDLLATDGASIENYARAWAIVLDESLKMPDLPAGEGAAVEAAKAERRKAAEAFVDSLPDVFELNEYVCDVYARDLGAPEDKKKAE